MARFYRRRKFCRFTAEGITHIDYKDIEILKQYVTESGKIESCYFKVQHRSVLAFKQFNFIVNFTCGFWIIFC